MADEQQSDRSTGSAGSGTEHSLGGKLKQAAKAVTGRDLDTDSPTESEAPAKAGPGGEDRTEQ